MEQVSLSNTAIHRYGKWKHTVLVVLVRDDPFIHNEATTGLENTVSLTVHILKLGRVAGSLDGIGSIEGVVSKWKSKEVTLLHSAQLIHLLLLDVLVGTLNLILRDRDTVNVGARHTSNVAERTAHTTTHVNHTAAATKKNEDAWSEEIWRNKTVDW